MSAGVTQLGAWRRDLETEENWPGANPTVPGAGHRIPLVSENISMDPQFQDQGVLFGQVSQEEAKLAGFAAGGTIECDLRYGTLDRLWAACLGFENPNTDATGGSPHLLTAGEYRHVYECHEILRSEQWHSGDRNASTGNPGDPGHWDTSHRKQARGGFYVSKGVTDWRLWPAMVESMEIQVNPRSSRVSFDLVGYKVERNDYSSSTWTCYNGEDYNDDPGVSQVLLPHLTAKFGSAGGSTWLDANLGVTSLTVRVQNNLKADDYDAAGGYYSLEPWRQGQRTVSGSFTLTRYAFDTLSTFLEADLNTMLQFVFTGPSLGTNNAQLAIGIPSAKLSRVATPVSGPEIVQQVVEWEAHASTAALGTVWQGVGEPFEGVTLTQDANGKPGEILLATVNTYDENVYEND
jgi:hypothetical protein